MNRVNKSAPLVFARGRSTRRNDTRTWIFRGMTTFRRIVGMLWSSLMRSSSGDSCTGKNPAGAGLLSGWLVAFEQVGVSGVECFVHIFEIFFGTFSFA